MRNSASKIMLFVLLIFALSCPSSFIFYPDRTMVSSPDRSGLTYEEIDFKTGDDVRLRGWWVPAMNPRYTVLFSHGNAGNISHRMDSIRIFHDLKLNVFIYDYRGYGMSGGAPSEKGTYLDVEAAWDYLVNTRKIDPGSIIVFGRSLGGAVACHAAVKFSPAMAVLESTFTSAADVANYHYKFIPGRLIFRGTYNTIQKIGEVKCPLLIIHSRDDEVIPFEQGERLFRAAGPGKYFLEIAGGHNSGFMMSLQKYRDGLNDFISRNKQGR